MMALRTITLKELQDFHNIDRQVYARLVICLGLDPYISKKIVAFWNWLETKGYTNFVNNMQLVQDALLNALAHEAITCIHCLNNQSFTPCFIDNDKYVPLMRSLVSQDFSLGFVYEDRENVIYNIDKFMKYVCDRVFCDIVPRNLTNGVHYFVPYSDSFVLNGVQVLGPHSECQPQFFLGLQDNGCHSQMGISQEAADHVTQNDRTLFITFSKGHPITKQELIDLITRKYGDCVEAVYMKIHLQPLFARVIVRSPSVLAEILGDKELVKFSINGKDAWARRFTPKHMEQQSLH